MNAALDQNRKATLLGVDSIGFTIPTTAAVDPSTHALLIQGTVTTTIDTTGLATATKQDTGNTSLGSIDTKTPALGQALSAASVPVVLTAAQISTLTPLSSVTVNTISGFALETGGNLATIAGAVSSSKMAVKAADGDITSFGSLTTAKSTATDTTSVGVIPLLKEISYMEQTPASRAVTNAGTFAVQSTLAAETTKVIGTVNQGTSPWVVSGAVTVNTITGFATSTNQSTEIAQLQTINSLTPSVYDYISLGYTGANLTTVIFKTGGAGGTTVSTLTLAYTGSVLNSVTKT